MRNLFSILLLTIAISSAGAADVIYRISIPFTVNPSASHSVTVNGTVKTFVAASPGANQVLIGATAADTALNYYTHLQTSGYDGLYSQISGSTVTLLADTVNEVHTASNSGGWGTITVTADDLTQYSFSLPLSGEPAATRAPVANGLVGAFDYATTQVPASSPAFTEFLNSTTTQTITGAKTFQNSANLFDGGRITNMTGASIASAWFGAVNISGDIGITNTTPRFIIYDSDAASNEKYSVITAGSGEFQINLYNDAFSTFNTALQIRRTGNTVDDIYFGAPLDVTGGGTFTGTILAPIISSTNLTGILTNANVFAKDITLSNLYFLPGGNGIWMTNTTPQINLYESDADADEKMWKLFAANGTLRLDMRSDSGLASSTVFTVDRTGFGTPVFYMDGNLTANGGFDAITGAFSTGLTAAAAGIDFLWSPMLHLTNTASPGADPTLGVKMFAMSGELRYRQVGSGVDHFGHNASAEYIGAGTDHSFVGTAYTQLAFGSGGNVITLPSAGTYFIYADLAIEAGGVANETFAAKFYNATSAADIVSSERQVSNIAASRRGQLFLYKIVTVTAGTTIHVYVKNSSSAAGAIDSVETKLGYLRMY